MLIIQTPLCKVVMWCFPLVLMEETSVLAH